MFMTKYSDTNSNYTLFKEGERKNNGYEDSAREYTPPASPINIKIDPDRLEIMNMSEYRD